MKVARAVPLAVLMMSVGVAAVAAADPFTVVLGGLQSPRGLTFGPGGNLYVAQAGAGDSSGKITAIRDPWTASPRVSDVISGLISIGQEGEFVGIDGISALGNGGIHGIMAESNAGEGMTNTYLGWLLKVSHGGQVNPIADVGGYDYAWAAANVGLAPNDFPDANPYGVLALPGRTYVADAGANTLDLVRPNGSIQILAYFPNNLIADATPTCVTQGPDGALYVGTLALRDSFAFGPSATVYRVDPALATPDNILTLATPWATGLWPINGCAFGPDGSFYASQLFTAPGFAGGDVVKIPFASPTTHTFLTGGALTVPGGVAVGPDGAVYVSNGSAFVPEGAVVRLTSH